MSASFDGVPFDGVSPVGRASERLMRTEMVVRGVSFIVTVLAGLWRVGVVLDEVVWFECG